MHTPSKISNPAETRHSDQRSVRSQCSITRLEMLPETRILDTQPRQESAQPSTVHMSAPPSSHRNGHNTHQRRPRSENQSTRRPLSIAIRRDEANEVRHELEQNPALLKEKCRHVNIYPIHWALRNDFYKALDVLLDKVEDKAITKQICDGQTALELACASSSHMGLECFQKYRDKFDFPKEIYKRHRR